MSRSGMTFASCLLLSVLGFAQGPPPSDTAAISLSVVVTEPSDRAVTGLSIKHFRLLEDEVEQVIDSVKENTLAGDYTLTYTPKNSATNLGWRRVRVEILLPGGPRLTARHAQGYRPK